MYFALNLSKEIIQAFAFIELSLFIWPCNGLLALHVAINFLLGFFFVLLSPFNLFVLPFQTTMLLSGMLYFSFSYMFGINLLVIFIIIIFPFGFNHGGI